VYLSAPFKIILRREILAPTNRIVATEEVIRFSQQ
jgi:hypothetical protein